MSQPTALPNNLTIPTLPAIVQRVTALVEDPETGCSEIGQVIAEDAPLAAKVLRIANSSYYGLRTPCVSAEQAGTVLGAKVLRNVITQAAVISQFQHLTQTGFDLDALWRHSILTAQACAYMARRCKNLGGLSPDEFYSCGLLHDLGQVVMLDGLGERYAAVVQKAHDEEVPTFIAERREFGFNHTAVGTLVATRWGLPKPVTEAIQFHHGPREAVRDNPVVSLVANTNILVHRVIDGDLEGATQVIDVPTARFLGLELKDVTEAVAHLADQVGLIEV
jgi:HD-like signal output (HDOD) protein